jgi:hypothetical protein
MDKAALAGQWNKVHTYLEQRAMVLDYAIRQGWNPYVG